MSIIQIEQIGITHLKTDAIVNAANQYLLQGGGVCGCIFEVAGEDGMRVACSKIGYCKPGYAVITPGFSLYAKHVIHAVGPVWVDGNHNEPYILYSAYMQSLIVAMINDCHSIAFPLISAGIYGYPKEDAWRRAFMACSDFIVNNPDYEIEITFAVLEDNVFEMGNRIRKELGV